MKVVPLGAITAKGIGKPDYQREVAAGRQRPGILLKYNQRFRVFAANWTKTEPLYPFILDNPLPAGGSVHLRDSDTNQLLPITIEAGYILSVIEIGILTTEDVSVYGYIDGLAGAPLAINRSGVTFHEARLRGQLSTEWYDPTASSPHSLDVIAYNEGAGDAYGAVALLCVEEAVGTPPWPSTKDCVCPYCGNVQRVDISTTRIKCSKCGKEYMVTNFMSLRQL